MAEPSAPKSDADEARDPTREFREAYETLIEPLINATIKLAEAESLQQQQRAHIEAVEAQLAEVKKALARSETELQAIYGSNSWRTAELLRRAARIVRRPHRAALTLLARCRGQGTAAMSRISVHWRDRAAPLERAWTST